MRNHDEESHDRYVSLVASPDDASFDFDDPAVPGAERATLAAFLPQLETNFIAMSTLMNDWFHCSGAITVFRAVHQRKRRLWPRLNRGVRSARIACTACDIPCSDASSPSWAQYAALRRRKPLAGRKLCGMTSAGGAAL